MPSVNKCFIKICGIRNMVEADCINEAMPDFAGFVFVSGSKRRVMPKAAEQLRSRIDKAVVTVGVFRDAEQTFIAEIAHRGIISAVQLHGSESGEYIERLRGLLAPDLPIIKAVSVADVSSIASCTQGLRGATLPDFLLYDSGRGGTGKTFGFELIDEARCKGKLPDIPFFIAGGIDADNIAEAVKRNPYGVDISSGVETDGFKDGAKVMALVNAVRYAKNNVISTKVR